MQEPKVPDRIKKDRRIQQAIFKIRKGYNHYHQWQRHLRRFYNALNDGFISESEFEHFCKLIELDDRAGFIRMMKAYK